MKYGKHKQNSLVPQHNSTKERTPTYLNRDAAFKIATQTGNNAHVFVSFRLLQNDYECFSAWTEHEMKAFWNFNRQIHHYAWQQILEQGGKLGHKVGFGYTELPRRIYPSQGFKDSISPDVEFFELRVNQRIRVHGFRDEAVFYLCWLDRNHEICN